MDSRAPTAGLDIPTRLPRTIDYHKAIHPSHAMLLSTYGASGLGKTFRRSIKHAMKPVEGSRTSGADGMGSTISKLQGGRAL
jgi:hypothetical protein